MHMVLKKIIYEEDMLRKRFKHTKKFGKKGLERFTLFLRMKKQTKGNAMQKTLGYMKNNSFSSPFFHFFSIKKNIYIPTHYSHWIICRCLRSPCYDNYPFRINIFKPLCLPCASCYATCK